MPISGPDNVASNGIIHVIDDVMFPIVLTSTEVITMDPKLSRIMQMFNATGVLQAILQSYLNGT